MRRFFLFSFLLAFLFSTGCGQATYDERLKGNIDNPKRMGGPPPAAENEDGEEEDEDDGWGDEEDEETAEKEGSAEEDGEN